MGRTTKGHWAATGLGALLVICGCADFAADACTDDGQCKLGRVCAQGVCVDPNVEAPLAAPTGAAGQDDRGPADAGATTHLATASSPTEPEPTAPAPEDAPPTVAEAMPARDTSHIEFLCTPGGAGACQNATDCPVIEDGSGKDVAKQCGIECATSLVAGCAEQCILERTELTQPCASCLDAFFDCILSNCLAVCISGSEQECTDCSRTRPAGNTCSDQWYACSGTELNASYTGG